MIQIAYAVLDATGYREHERILMTPFDVVVSEDASRTNGISTERVRREGVHPVPQLEQLLTECLRVQDAGGRVVAHNASFDKRMIRQTLARQEALFGFNIDMFCLQSRTSKHSPLVNACGARKPFRNEELHDHLFNEKTTEKLHDALGDVRVTLRNYLECERRGWFG